MELLLKCIGLFPDGAMEILSTFNRSETEANIYKLIVVARAYAGDRRVAEEVYNMVTQSDDMYLRYLSIKAYGRCLGEASIPVLRQYKQDTTVSDYSGGRGYYLLREAAKDAFEHVVNAVPSPVDVSPLYKAWH